MMSPNDPRMVALRNAANVTRQQSAMIEEKLKQYSDEELERELDRDESLREFLTIDADKNNNGILVNYTNQPNNGQQEFGFNPTWGNGMTMVNPGFYSGNNYGNSGNYYNNFMTQQQNTDERLQVYNQHPGMRLYNINPYAFYDAQDMLDWYNNAEKEREKQVMLNYVLLTFGTEDKEWAADYLYKHADDIVREQEEEKRRIQMERIKEIYGDENERKTVYDVYDSRGYIFRRAVSFTVTDYETGEVIKVVNKKKDENGQSYEIHTYAEEKAKELEIQQMYDNIAREQRFNETFHRLFTQAYIDNINRWERWKQEGLTLGEMYQRYEDERVDWVKQERLIYRALQTQSYSRKDFSQILSECYDTEFKYSNRSKFFYLSYDYARDFRYKELTSTPEEMENDPLVHQKLQQEYEIKRNIFMERANTGNLMYRNKGDLWQVKPTLPKPNLNDLTIEDFDKPENQISYTALSSPELVTENLFIPDKPKKKVIPEEERRILAKNGVFLDENGNIIPQGRTITNVTVDDETGQIISQNSFDVPPECYNPYMRQASDDMTDEELMEMF